MKSATKLAALGVGLGLVAAGCGSGTVIVAMVSPTISQVSPQVVTAGTPSVTVTVQGSNFQSNASVTVNGTAMPTTVVNTTTLSAKISGSPLAQPAVAHLQVKNTNGGSSNEVPLTVTSASQASSLAIGTSGLAGAQSGTAYSASMSASGGTPGYIWSITSGSLPAGLNLSSSGLVSGTPTASGTSTFSVTVSDSSSPAQTQTVTLSIVVLPVAMAPATLGIASAALGSGQVGASYTASLSASGGTPGYTWSLASGSLPAGLTLSSAGIISGTPTGSGTSAFSIAVTDSGSPAQRASAQVSITVLPSGLAVRSLSLGAGIVGSSYSTTLSATGGTAAYTWSLASGSLPAGLTLSSGGVISGTPTASGTSSFTVKVTDSESPAQSASAPESLTIDAANLAITSASLGSAKDGSSYSATLSATGGTPGYTWSLASGSLPAGLSLSSGGGISGTPTGSGTASFAVTVTDSGSPQQTASLQESITVASAGLAITSTTLGAAKDGSSYSTPLSATGGTPDYTWSLASGSLPTGLTLSSGGVISGTPTATGTSTFTVKVTDSGSPQQTASLQESITVAAAPATLTITSSNLGAGQTGSGYNTTLSATGGTPGYTWSLASGSLPAGLTLSSGGVISGTPTGTGSPTFTVKVTDSDSPAQTASAQESITVSAGSLTITSANPGSGTTDVGYSVTLNASGGVPAYSWSVSSGSLPDGLTLSSAGVISGTPTGSGTSTFTVAVADNESPAQNATAQETITINAATQSTPAGGAQLYIYPQAPVAPRGSYQTVTAIVTGVSNTTVTWSSDGGSIVGTNPCVVNEPCTIALYSASTGTYQLTATSNANQQVTATSAITFTASPAPRMDHPRFMVTSDMISSLRAKANTSDPMYQGINWIANNYYTKDSSVWTFSTWNGNGCSGGSGPRSDQSGNSVENDAWWMTLVALVDPNTSTRNQFGCAARDVFMTNIGYVLSGEVNLGGGNRWSDGATEWAFTADYLMGGGYLSPSDQAIVRQYLAKLAYEEINNTGNGVQAVIGNYNSAAQFDESNQYSTTNMRAMGNNYTQARMLIFVGAALTFNDNSTDDPPLSNTCSATRYQVCPDGTAGSLHAYWTYLTGGLFYKYWANMDDPNVVQQAYNASYNNLSSQPMCETLWKIPTPCIGGARGGEPSEGFGYGGSTATVRRAMNAIQTAGYDDPLVYGPQMSLGTMSYWDLRYVADFSGLTGLSGLSTEQSRWNFLTDGDSLYYFAYPANFATESALLSADAMTGRTDRSQALEWLVTNTAYGLANGKTGNCIFYCGFDAELGNDYGSSVALDLFLALPGEDPVTSNPPADPRPSLPTDWYDAGNQHIVARDGWGTNRNTIFSYFCTNTQIDHEHEFCGGFDLYSKGEYITKGRMEFNDYNDAMSLAWDKNAMALVQSPGQTICAPNTCTYWQAVNYGGQFWHGYQGGLATLYHSALPGYVAAIAEDHNAYNGGWGGYATYFSAITAASRSLLYLRGANQVIYYDRGATGSNAWDKTTYLVTTGAPSFKANTASWLTRSGNQKVYWTALEPSANTPQLDTTYTDADATNDWEIYGRIKADAGNVASARFLSVLQWGPSTFSGTAASFVTSSAGTPFEGALVGSSLVLFMRDWPATFASVTYAASGATTDYISDLTPNTAYSISAAGAPASASTDSAGVLVFPAAGTGNITVSAKRNGKTVR